MRQEGLDLEDYKIGTRGGIRVYVRELSRNIPDEERWQAVVDLVEEYRCTFDDEWSNIETVIHF